MKSIEIKPQREAFIWYRILKSLFVFIVTWGIAFLPIASTPMESMGDFFIYVLIFIGSAIILAITLINRYIGYKKEKYVIEQDKIIKHSGGILFDRQTEVVIRNVTHLERKIPYIENQLFHTGDIMIQSTGSKQGDLNFQSIEEYESLYDELIARMNNNGFDISLKQDQLVQQESPSVLGVLVDVVNVLISSVFTIFFILMFIVDSTNNLASIFSNGAITLLAILALLLFIIGLGAFLVIKYMDLKKRIYSIYTNVISYNEGFFTKHFSIVPMKNLADSAVTKNFLQTLFNFADVKLSPQGSGKDIIFKNMSNSKALEENIDKLLEDLKNKETTKAAGSPETQGREQLLRNESKNSTDPNLKKYQPERVEEQIVQTDYTAQFKMSLLKLFLQPLISLLIGGAVTFVLFIIEPATIFICGMILFFMLFAFISPFIQYYTTNYFVKKNSIKYSYKFFTTNELEFNNEKIVSVEFIETILDRLIGTCSIRFISIGSTDNILFSHIKKTDGLFEEILKKIGIEEKDNTQLKQIKPEFGLIQAIASKVVFLSVLGVLSIVSTIWIIANLTTSSNTSDTIGRNFIPFGILGLILFGSLIYLIRNFIFHKLAKLDLYENFIALQKGIFVKLTQYAKYKDIKSITTKKYSFTDYGDLVMDIAGESVKVIKTKNGERKEYHRNQVSLGFLPVISEMDDLLDGIMLTKPTQSSFDETSLVEKITSDQGNLEIIKPDVRNDVFALFLASLIIWPLFLYLPILILRLIKTSYILEDERIIAKTGIIHRTQTSILYQNIDHLDKSKGITNKLFNNENVDIYTIGSDNVEMRVKSISRGALNVLGNH